MLVVLVPMEPRLLSRWETSLGNGKKSRSQDEASLTEINILTQPRGQRQMESPDSERLNSKKDLKNRKIKLYTRYRKLQKPKNEHQPDAQ